MVAASNPDDYCREPCPGAPTTHYNPGGGLLVAGSGTERTASHAHHKCWNCAAEVISRLLSQYSCLLCGCEYSTYYQTSEEKEFDPEVAATLSSPA